MQVGKFLPLLSIDASTLEWVPVPEYVIPFDDLGRPIQQESSDYVVMDYTKTGTQRMQLRDHSSSGDEAVTGKKFILIPKT